MQLMYYVVVSCMHHLTNVASGHQFCALQHAILLPSV